MVRSRPVGVLVPDVRIGDWAMPWNAKAEARRLAPGIPKSDYWASDPGGIEQVGCIYTAQGFEFDYVGVIFGPDLVYRPLEGGWVGRREASHDSVVRRSSDAAFLRYVKSTYRVLLTRGLRGCYVYFMDEPTRDFFQAIGELGSHGRPVGWCLSAIPPVVAAAPNGLSRPSIALAVGHGTPGAFRPRPGPRAARGTLG